jgi:predicted acetyltransferase
VTSDRPSPAIRPIGHDRADELLALDQWAFAVDIEGHEPEIVVDGLDWDRTYGAWLSGPQQDDRLAGIYSSYALRCPVPGGEVPAAGLTWVGVHPRDRRRGVLTAMMAHHLDDVRRRGEPVSLLTAAEPAIYGRFGYGVATEEVVPQLARGAALRDVPGSSELVVDLAHADVDRQVEELAACYAAAGAGRPGWVSRDDLGNQRLPFYDPPRHRHGAESLRVITVREPTAGQLRGYALFRRRRSWKDGLPDGTVEVRELIALDGVASHALWTRLLDLDLMARVEGPGLPLDDPLLHQLVDARAAAPRRTDGIWARIVDVPAALAARRYAGGIDVVLDVADSRFADNADRWLLRGDRDGASCTRTDRPADVVLDVRELGCLLLGGTTLSALAGAGLVSVTDDKVLQDASIAFSWPIAPYCPWDF